MAGRRAFTASAGQFNCMVLDRYPMVWISTAMGVVGIGLPMGVPEIRDAMGFNIGNYAGHTVLPGAIDYE